MSLVYFYVATKEYIPCLQLALQTAKKDIVSESVTVLVICAPELEEQIKQIEEVTYTWIVPSANQYSGKYEILGWPHINDFEAILYCDADVLFFPFALKTLLSQLTVKDVFAVVPSRLDFLDKPFAESGMYTTSQKEQIQDSKFNRGCYTCVIGWKRSQKCLDQWKRIKDEYARSTQTDDQPYINKHLLLEQNVNYVYGALVCSEPEPYVMDIWKANKQVLGTKHFRFQPITLHFLGISKQERMERISKMLLDIKTE